MHPLWKCFLNWEYVVLYTEILSFNVDSSPKPIYSVITFETVLHTKEQMLYLSLIFYHKCRFKPEDKLLYLLGSVFSIQQVCFSIQFSYLAASEIQILPLLIVISLMNMLIQTNKILYFLLSVSRGVVSQIKLVDF